MSRIAFLGVDADYTALVAERFPDAFIEERVLNGDDITSVCSDAEIISASFGSRFPRDILEKLPKLKLLCTRSVGFDQIDIGVCSERGITVCNVPDYGSHVIAEHVFALLLSTLRHITEADMRVGTGNFDYHGLKGMALKDKTIGIVGTGKIGFHAAEIALGFGMHVLAVDRCRNVDLERDGVEYVSLEEMFAKSDILTLHIPATADTKGMLNAKAFAQMKDGVIVVNTARGALIDKSALLEALGTEKVKYALLDVLEPEKDYEKNKDLIDHPKVVVTPHIAFYAEESMGNMFTDSFQSIHEFLAGKTPEHLVRPPAVVCDNEGVMGKEKEDSKE